MKRKYFTECVPEVDVDFYIVSDVTTADDATATPTGAVSINIIGGVGPYTFTWSQVTSSVTGAKYPTTTTTQNISGLVGGVYNVEVIDSNGTVANGSFIVQGPTSVSCNVQSTNLTSNLANDGTISINVNGGSPDYTYELFNYNTTSQAIVGTAIQTNKITITSKVFSNLPAGDYMVKVTDSTAPTPSSCENIVNIADSPALIVTLTPENITCNGNDDGNIKATITGGVPPYDTEWTSTDPLSSYGPFDSVFKISDLEVDEYELKVTDGTGTVVSKTETITEPAVVTFTSSVTNGCNGSKGNIEISNIVGGTPPYKIELRNDEISYYVDRPSANPTLESFTNLANGSTLYEEKPYELTITDHNGCVASTIIELFVPKTPLSVTLVSVPFKTIDASNNLKTFTVIANGGIYQNDINKGTIYNYQVQIQRKIPGGSFTNLGSKVTLTSPPTTYNFNEDYNTITSVLGQTLAPNPNPPITFPLTPVVSTTIDVYEYRAIVYDKNGDADGCNETSNVVTVDVEVII